MSYVGVIKKQEAQPFQMQLPLGGDDARPQIYTTIGGSGDKYYGMPTLSETDEKIARESTLQSTISGEPVRGFKEAKFKPHSMQHAAAYGVTPAVGAELPRGVTREQIYNLAGKYGGGLGRAADIASKLYGTVRGLTALQRATASGTDALSALGTAGLQGYTAAQTLAPVAVRAGTGIGSRFGRDVALAGAEPEPKPQPTIAEPIMVPPAPSPPTSVLNPKAVAANVERYNRELKEFEDYNRLLADKNELEEKAEEIPTDSQGNPLFEKNRELMERLHEARRELNQRAMTDAAMGIPPVGPATPPPVASPTLPPTYDSEQRKKIDAEILSNIGSSIPANEISEIPSTSLEQREKTPEEIQMEELEKFANATNNQMG